MGTGNEETTGQSEFVAQQMEQRLERFTRFVEGTDDLLTEVDREGRFIYVNHAAKKIFGLEPQHCVGRPAFDFIHPDDQQSTMAAFGGWIEQRLLSVTHENRQVSVDGQVRHMLWTINPHYDDQGQLISITSIARDVTRRHRMEQLLRITGEELERRVKKRTADLATEKERLAVTLRSIGDGVITTDTGGRVTMLNLVAEELTGWTTGDARGRDLPEVFCIINEQTREACEDPVARVLRTGVVVGLANNTVLVARDGTERIVADSGAPILDSEGGILGGVLVFRDITEKRRAGLELQRHRDHLEELVEERTEELRGINASLAREIDVRREAEQQLEAKATDLARSNHELEQFAYVASHDLQEPLRMVSTFSQMLLKKYHGALDQDADDYLKYVIDGASRMQALILALLAFSRVSSQGKELQQTDCGELVQRVLVDLQVTITECGAEVACGELPTVRADPSQLQQLLQNLLSNAIKFKGDRSPRVQIEARACGAEWVFEVRDNGIGIEARYHERIFVIFQRLHGIGDFPGTGIGLALCKKIVQRHGGRIWLESEPGRGSTFYFALPR